MVTGKKNLIGGVGGKAKTHANYHVEHNWQLTNVVHDYVAIFKQSLNYSYSCDMTCESEPITF